MINSNYLRIMNEESIIFYTYFIKFARKTLVSKIASQANWVNYA